MYGYIVVDQPELKFREFDKYRSYYCGLCDSLAEAHGLKGQISLSYDMTFLVILLTGLYEPETIYSEERCFRLCCGHECPSDILQMYGRLVR